MLLKKKTQDGIYSVKDHPTLNTCILIIVGLKKKLKSTVLEWINCAIEKNKMIK